MLSCPAGCAGLSPVAKRQPLTPSPSPRSAQHTAFLACGGPAGPQRGLLGGSSAGPRGGACLGVHQQAHERGACLGVHQQAHEEGPAWGFISRPTRRGLLGGSSACPQRRGLLGGPSAGPQGGACLGVHQQAHKEGPAWGFISRPTKEGPAWVHQQAHEGGACLGSSAGPQKRGLLGFISRPAKEGLAGQRAGSRGALPGIEQAHEELCRASSTLTRCLLECRSLRHIDKQLSKLKEYQ
eukprot:jgi/Chrzof1/3384/Cz12g23130.t1